MSPENNDWQDKQVSLLEKAKSHDPKRSFEFNAVDIFTDPDDIRRFMAEYAEYLSTVDDPIVNCVGPLRAASIGMGHVLAYISDDAIALWQGALEGLEHPYFRTMPKLGH